MSSIAHLKLNLRALCREGRLKDAMHIVLTTHISPIDVSTYLQLLQTCIAKNALSEGKLIHSFINEGEFTFATRSFFQNKLINMYVKCGGLVDGRKVFDHMTERDVFSWNMMIAAYRRRGISQEALTLFHQMQLTSAQPDQFTFASILPACAQMGSLEQAVEIHQRIIESGLLSDNVIGNALVDMYAKCGSIQKARHLFDKMPQRDAVSWTSMISGYAQNGFLDEASRLFKEMPQRSVVSWHVMIVGYAQNGDLDEALKYFEEMPQPNVVSWTGIIAGYSQNGLADKALEIFKKMQSAGVKTDSAALASILPACAKLGALEQGMEIHRRMIESEFLSDVVVVTALIDMYAKCGSIQNARKLFDKLSQRNVVSWNVMIAGYAQNGVLDEAWSLFKAMPQLHVVSMNAIIVGYAQNGFFEKALEIFKQMQLVGVKPDSTTFASILPPSGKLGALEMGMEIHQKIIEDGFLSDVVVVTALIDMYAKCGSIHKAHELFDKLPQRNVVTWNAIIAGYAQNGVFHEALSLFNNAPHRNVATWNAIIAGYAQNGLAEKSLESFRQMQITGAQPDQFTFASILPACAKMGALKQGMEIHQRIFQSSFLSDVIVVNALIDMYAKCASIQKAQELFEKMPHRDVISWNAVISGYAQNGVLDKALTLFKEMPERNVVSWNAMIVGYVQKGALDDALKFFKEMPEQNVVSWTAMIAGYSQNGLVEKALEIYKQMQFAGVIPNSATFASILPACAKMGALEQGMEIHQRIMKCRIFSDVIIVTALIDMYAKCGSIEKARKLFDKIPRQDTVSWNAMLAGYAMHGYGNDALKFFELMKDLGTNPNHVSFICVLFACSHAGMVDEGCKYFNQMSYCYCIMPTMDHYVCMVDLLGRAGFLEEGLNFIIKMPIKPDVVVWICLLGACRSHKNIGLGEFVATLLFELDPKNTAPYVLLSNIYAQVGRWGDVKKVWTFMKYRGIKKTPGCSWIEVNKMVHVFCVGDKSHPQTQEINAKLEKLSSEMKAAGYIPELIPVLDSVEAEEKELFLCHHSEKLAIAFGLLNTSPGTTIRVVKNLRVCVDCHTATKFISKIVAREIVVRDANRFHHFKHGQCSCGDYW